MEKISLGQSTLKSSRIGYGCWRVLGLWETAEGLPDLTPERLDAARRAILTAYEAGYTLFDHADIYADGEAEKTFGQVLKSVSGMRERVQIVSKCGIRKQGEPDADSPYRYDFSADHIIKSCEGSLKRLGVETIDLYLLHRPDYLVQPEEVAAAFSKLRQAGKALEFGASNFLTWQFTLLQKFCPMPLIVHQVEISLAKLDAFHDGTVDQCRLHAVTPMAWAPLAGGQLGSNDPIDLREPDHAHRIQLRETLDLVARARGVARSTVVLAWLLKHPARIVPLVGSSDPVRIRELSLAASLELSREEWYRLLEAAVGARLP